MLESEPPLPDYDFVGGATLLVDKPKGWTSFDVVNKIRYRLKRLLGLKNIKVGHAGTLDPMATGLLIICTGKFTRQLGDFQGLDKSYTGTLRLGATTPSYDAETEVDEWFPYEHITAEQIELARQQWMGDIEQLPPMFSAIKVDGQPLYKKARKGEVVAVNPRPVRIHAFDITELRLPDVDFYVHCSKGTYIRSLAYDLGKTLGSGAYLTALCRTSIGEFELKNAWRMDKLMALFDSLDKPSTPDTPADSPTSH